MSGASRSTALATRRDKRGPPRMLVVDDEGMLLRAWTRQFEQAGIEVSVASSVHDAVAVLARAGSDLDVIVCDLHMADGSGTELYRFLEAQYPGLQHRVVFITGGVLSDSEGEFLRATGQPVLDKPCAVAALATIARDWATRRRAGLGPRAPAP